MPQVSCPYSAYFECDLQHIVCQAPPGRGSRSARTELSRREGGWLLKVVTDSIARYVAPFVRTNSAAAVTFVGVESVGVG